MRKVTAVCPGSCGELLQGWVGGAQVLVSCGINRFSSVSVYTERKVNAPNLKVQLAAIKTLEALHIAVSRVSELSIEVNTDLPIAKGMASSTADIAATCKAVAAFFDRKITTQTILTICLAIERTDSTLFSSLTLFEQKKGLFKKISGWCPHYYIIVLEPSQQIVTEAFHSKETEERVYQQRRQFAKVYQNYLHAVEKQNLQKLGEAASQSASLNQTILPKPFFSEINEIRRKHHLLGVNVAHSGSVVGLMVETQKEIPIILAALQRSALNKWYSHIYVHQSCYQGVQLVEARKINEKIDGCRSF